MKRLSLFSALAMLLTNSSFAEESEDVVDVGACKLTGVYAGADAGLAIAKAKIKSAKSKGMDKTGALFDIYAGHGWGFTNGLYLGANAGLKWDTADHKKSLGSLGAFKSFKVKKFKREFAIPLEARAGYLVWTNLLLYAKAGIEISRYKSNVSFSIPLPAVKGSAVKYSTKSINKKKTQTMPLIGLGGDYYFTKNLYGRLEYDYLFNNTVKVNNCIKLKREVHGLKVGLGWKF